MLDHDDKRVLNKRKKRGAAKVEDCNLDLESFMHIKKRQRVDQMLTAAASEEDTSVEGGLATLVVEVPKEQREQIKRKLIEKYFSELPE